MIENLVFWTNQKLHYPMLGQCIYQPFLLFFLKQNLTLSLLMFQFFVNYTNLSNQFSLLLRRNCDYFLHQISQRQVFVP